MVICANCLWLKKNTFDFLCGHTVCEDCVSTLNGRTTCPLDNSKNSDEDDDEHMDVDVIDVFVGDDELLEDEREESMNGIDDTDENETDSSREMTSGFCEITSSSPDVDMSEFKVNNYEVTSYVEERSEDECSEKQYFEYKDPYANYEYDDPEEEAMRRGEIKRKNYISSLEKTIANKQHYYTSQELSYPNHTVSITDIIDFSDSYSFTLKVKHFSRKRESAKNGSDEILFTESFTHEGYALSILFCPNGVGEARGNYISMYFQVVEGPFDDKLRWPLRFNARFVLIDKLTGQNDFYFVLSPEKSIVLAPTKHGLTFSRGEKRFFPIDQLEPNYLVKDCLRVKLQIIFI